MGDQEPLRWTEERIGRLRDMWAGGSSAGQIAMELGGITRNTVIGKLDRLGLLKSRNLDQAVTSLPATAPRTRIPAPRPPVQVPVASPPKAAVPAAAPSAPVQRTATVVAAPRETVRDFLPRQVTIMELGADMCRWPLGDPSGAEFRYCGNASNAGQPYCPHHAVMAYEPPRQRSGR